MEENYSLQCSCLEINLIKMKEKEKWNGRNVFNVQSNKEINVHAHAASIC